MRIGYDTKNMTTTGIAAKFAALSDSCHCPACDASQPASTGAQAADVIARYWGRNLPYALGH